MNVKKCYPTFAQMKPPSPKILQKAVLYLDWQIKAELGDPNAKKALELLKKSFDSESQTKISRFHLYKEIKALSRELDYPIPEKTYNEARDRWLEKSLIELYGNFPP